MPFMLAVLIAGGVAGVVGGGRLRRLREVRLRWVGALVLGLVVQVTSDLAAARGWIDQGAAAAGLGASLVLVLSFVWANRRVPGMWLAGLGFLLNLVVIAANGAMPVDPAALDELGVADPGRIAGKHELLDARTRLRWLADVIPVPPLRTVLSVGDLILAAGIVRVAAALLQGDDGSRRDRPEGIDG